MKSRAAVIAVIMTVCSVVSAESFGDLQSEFEQKIVLLASDTTLSTAQIQTRVGEYAKEIFGKHPDIMRKETAKRLKALPKFPKDGFEGYVTHNTHDQSVMASEEIDAALLPLGYQPTSLAYMAVQPVVLKELGVQEFGRLAMLKAYRPDKLYRYGKGKCPDLVIESLGDIFVVELEMTEHGFCRPTSVRWMQKAKSEKTAANE